MIVYKVSCNCRVDLKDERADIRIYETTYKTKTQEKYYYDNIYSIWKSNYWKIFLWNDIRWWYRRYVGTLQ